MDTMKVAPGVYQYTAIDDCSRFRVLGLYPQRRAVHTVVFLERVTEEMPFPVQRVQTDRGGEFFGQKVQDWLRENFIKFRPVPPRSPHLNGEVERSQAIDLQEFWALRGRPRISDEDDLQCWQFDYNWRRPHGSLGTDTPATRVGKLIDRIPDREAVAGAFDAANEPLRHMKMKADVAAELGRAMAAARSKQLPR